MPNFRLGALGPVTENVTDEGRRAAGLNIPFPCQPRSLESQRDHQQPWGVLGQGGRGRWGHLGRGSTPEEEVGHQRPASTANLCSAGVTANLGSSSPFLSLQLNSEYRSTFQWHDFAKPSALKHDVIRKPPPPSNYGKTVHSIYHISTNANIIYPLSGSKKNNNNQ